MDLWSLIQRNIFSAGQSSNEDCAAYVHDVTLSFVVLAERMVGGELVDNAYLYLFGHEWRYKDMCFYCEFPKDGYCARCLMEGWWMIDD